jgi:hypothetical protein
VTYLLEIVTSGLETVQVILLLLTQLGCGVYSYSLVYRAEDYSLLNKSAVTKLTYGDIADFSCIIRASTVAAMLAWYESHP